MAKKIMIVDDDEIILGVIADVLKPNGYEVMKANGAEEAIKQIKEIKPDLMIIDYYMPGMTGIELYIKVKEDESLKDTKVLFLTAANFSQDKIDQLEKMGIADYIEKPFDYNDLLKRIKVALDK